MYKRQGNNDLFPQADYLGKFYNADGTLINTSVENNFGIMRQMCIRDRSYAMEGRRTTPRASAG